MDPVTIGFGVASLLPLPVELFKQSIQAYKMFLEARDLEKTVTHFSLRLDIEYHRLVQWGNDCGLSSAPEQPGATCTTRATTAASLLFRNPMHKDLVERILGHIKEIFDDAAVLNKKYGIVFKSAKADASEVFPLLDLPVSLALEQPASEVPEAHAALIPGPPATQAGNESLKRKRDNIIPWVKNSVRRVGWVVKDKEGFEKLLKDLAQLNQSLYDLCASDISRAITRDALARFIRLADKNTLGALSRVGGSDISDTTLLPSLPTFTSATQESIFPYTSIPATASIAYSLRHKSFPKDSARAMDRQDNDTPDLLDVSANLANITFDSHLGSVDEFSDSDMEDGGSLATWKKSSGAVETAQRVFIVRKRMLITNVSMRLPQSSGHLDKTVPKFEKETEKVKRLAHLLHQAGSATVFRSLRCIAMTQREAHHSVVCLLFKLPGWADPDKEPLTLADALKRSSPSLTTRFSLAKALVSAVYQLHSASWMHRKISSRRILFFKRLHSSPDDPTAPTGSYDYRNPYLDLFKHSRARYFDPGQVPDSSSQTPDHRAFFSFLKDIYRHPSYMLKKAFWKKPHSYHQFRHEYYSVGLVLLEVGLWLTLTGLDLASTPLWDELMGSLSNNVVRLDTSAPGSPPSESDWPRTDPGPLGLWFTRSREQLERFPHICDNDDATKLKEFVSSQPCSSEFVRKFMEALERGIQDEQMDCQTLEAFYFWRRCYPYDVFRQLAISYAEMHLGTTMGEKYQKLVVRCLKSDFGVQLGADESAWLQAFNWHVVREIEQCCV
ncbi:prion-inhibition and propagation-domain-containing protein [Cladorrhinum sp. PSN259]|nr:prion-inhibition and propagation-domain-containing protein [Cladorrhinum sp. PSN259]